MSSPALERPGNEPPRLVPTSHARQVVRPKGLSIIVYNPTQHTKPLIEYVEEPWTTVSPTAASSLFLHEYLARAEYLQWEAHTHQHDLDEERLARLRKSVAHSLELTARTSLSRRLRVLTRGLQLLIMLSTLTAAAAVLFPAALPWLGASMLFFAGLVVHADFAVRGESIMHPKAATLFVVAGLGSFVVAGVAALTG